MTTAEKKTAAIRAMHDEICTRGQAFDTAKWTAETLAARIRELSTVIRSPKWRNAVESYAQFVEENPQNISWAYFQGSVYFAYEIS